MGEIVVIILFLAAGLTVRLVRVVRHRQLVDTRTREWIDFLREDLSASSL